MRSEWLVSGHAAGIQAQGRLHGLALTFHIVQRREREKDRSRADIQPVNTNVAAMIL